MKRITKKIIRIIIYELSWCLFYLNLAIIIIVCCRSWQGISLLCHGGEMTLLIITLIILGAHKLIKTYKLNFDQMVENNRFSAKLLAFFYYQLKLLFQGEDRVYYVYTFFFLTCLGLLFQLWSICMEPDSCYVLVQGSFTYEQTYRIIGCKINLTMFFFSLYVAYYKISYTAVDDPMEEIITHQLLVLSVLLSSFLYCSIYIIS